ncbi:hypothetical protein MYX82_02675 [Acidobacteria bacterium AH-259-D05]|nr:hypothetical protein [Acidobacteria bacterium AH-259-D05]
MPEQDDLGKKDVNITLKALNWWYLLDVLKGVCEVNPPFIISGNSRVPMNFYSLKTIVNLTDDVEKQLFKFADMDRLIKLARDMEAQQKQPSGSVGFTAHEKESESK